LAPPLKGSWTTKTSVATRGTKTSGSLAASRYRVSFIAKEALDLPSYLGSTLRGAFGHAFRAISCPAPHGGPCPVFNQCPYHQIFETSPPPGSGALRTHEEIPRPFVIAPALTSADTRRRAAEPMSRSPELAEGVCDVRTAQTSGHPGRQQFNPGYEVSFELILIGRAQEFFPYFVVALREVDRMGRGRHTVELQHIEALPAVTGGTDTVYDAADVIPRPNQGEVRRGSSGSATFALVSDRAHIVYDAADNLVRGAADRITLEECAALPLPQGPLTIEFLTQTRLKHEGRFIRHPGFQVVFRRLLGRLSSLARFHCGAPLEVDFRGLIDQAASIGLAQDGTKWTRWQRYSSRQDRHMEWEGIIGCATYEGDFTPFWEFMKFGELVHVGHGTTFGLGKYRVVGAESARNEHQSES
jgi:hypothetical protein